MNELGIELRIVAEGVLIPVQGQPGSRRNGLTGVHNGRLKVAVTQAPEKGKANKELAKVLADAIGLKGSQVSLAAGLTSSQKEFLVTGLSAAELTERLRMALEALPRKR